MNPNSFTDIRFYKNTQKLEQRDALANSTGFGFDTMKDLFGSFLDDGLLSEKTASILPPPFEMTDKQWLNDSPLAIVKHNLQPGFDSIEGFNQRFISDELVRHLSQANNPRMEFSIEQGQNKIDVNAMTSAGIMSLDLRPSNDLLGKRIKRLKQDIERNLGKRMHVLVEISVI